MKEQIIQLESYDDVTSVLDKLGWIRASRVLLVFPEDPDRPILRRRLDLLLIQRETTRRRAHLALITTDADVADNARELGIPCFPTVAASHHQQWRTESARLRLPRSSSRASRTPTRSRFHAPPPSERGVPRGLAIVLFVLAITALLAGLYIIVPGATIYLIPAATQATVTTNVTADPNVANVEHQAAIIPARIIGVEVEWSASQETTGTIDQPSEKATGIVLFSNRVPDQVTIPAGTVVRTTAAQPVRFVTLTDVTLPARIGATVEAPIEAAEPGVEANLPSNRINEVEGPLGVRVAVTNPEPTRGGDIVQVSAVSLVDYHYLRETLIEQLQQRAYAEMQFELGQTEFIPTESLATVLVLSETYDRYIGEAADVLSLTMRVVVQAVVVDERYARQVIYEQMAERVGAGYRIQTDALLFRRGDVIAIDADRRVSFVMQGTGDVVAAVDPAHVQSLVRGRTVRDAQVLLEHEFVLAAPPRVELWLPFWPQMPVLPFRINVVAG